MNKKEKTVLPDILMMGNLSMLINLGYKLIIQIKKINMAVNIFFLIELKINIFVELPLKYVYRWWSAKYLLSDKILKNHVFGLIEFI